MGAFKRAVNLFYFFSSRKAVESSVVTRTGKKDEVPTSGSLPTESLLDVGVGHAELGCSGAWNPWQTEPSGNELVLQRPLVSSPTFLPPRWTRQAGGGDSMPVSQETVCGPGPRHTVHELIIQQPQP